MKILIVLLILVSSSFNYILSQGIENRNIFYELEQNNWKGIISDTRTVDDQSNLDIKFYHLDIEIGIHSPFIKGSVKSIFEIINENTNKIVFDLHNAFQIDSITGFSNTFDFSNNTISIYSDSLLNKESNYELIIYYSGIPQLAGDTKGLRYETHGNNEPVIASLSTPFLAHYWWPCRDGPSDKADSVFIDITIPDTLIQNLPLIAVSNGILERTSLLNNKKTFHWRERYPIVPYYVMVAISNYYLHKQNYITASESSFPIDYYTFQENLEQTIEGTNQIPEVMTFFSKLFGEYPFSKEKYGMTELGFYGAIENQTNTITNNMSSEWFLTSVHELAHMWFGDMITSTNWHHAWLNEGFATYCEALWLEYKYGNSAYSEFMNNIEYKDGGSVYLDNISDPFNIFLSIIYRKGAYVLHMLRGILGDQIFFKALSEYSNSPELMYKHSTTEDFQKICEEVSGLDLEYFFNQWIYGENHPAYSVNWSYSNLDSDLYLIHLTINQQRQMNPDFFKMPIELLIQTNLGDTSFTVFNDQISKKYEFHVLGFPTEIKFDPDNWILKDSVDISFNNQLPTNYFLSQNYPNPFNRSTTIRYNIPNLTKGYFPQVKLNIYDMLGRHVFTLVDQKQTAGNHQIIFDDSKIGKQLASGVYYYQIIIDNFIKTNKMILLK